MRHPKEFFEPILLRKLARVFIVWLTFLFVVNTTVAINLEKWVLVAVGTLNLGVCWWCMKRLWPEKRSEPEKDL
jgi:hypothetical protein